MTEPSGNPGKLPATSDDIVQRARAALDGITPGPWWWTAETRARLIALGADKHELTDAREIIRCAALLHPGEADARFIAAAPDLVRELADELEATRRSERENQDLAIKHYVAKDDLQIERDELRAEVETAQKWAAWFAAAYNWRRECDNALNWGTTCLNCASMLDRSYDDYMRAEEAEQKAKAASREVEKLHAAVERVRELIDDDHHVWEDSDGDGLWVHVDNVRRALDGEAARG